MQILYNLLMSKIITDSAIFCCLKKFTLLNVFTPLA